MLSHVTARFNRTKTDNPINFSQQLQKGVGTCREA